MSLVTAPGDGRSALARRRATHRSRSAASRTTTNRLRRAAATVLWEQLARRVGSQTTVHAGGQAFRGAVLASYPEFLVLRTDDGAEHLIRHGSAVSIALPAEPPPLRPAPAASRRYQLGLALRELARRREPVRALLADGTSCDGTIEAVGSDYLEIAEHHIGEARRRGAVRARRFIGFAAVVAVSLPQERR